MRERHFRGSDGLEITPDGRRPILWVIRDWLKIIWWRW